MADLKCVYKVTTLNEADVLDATGTEMEPDAITDGNPFRRPSQKSREFVTLVDTEF